MVLLGYLTSSANSTWYHTRQIVNHLKKLDAPNTPYSQLHIEELLTSAVYYYVLVFQSNLKYFSHFDISFFLCQCCALNSYNKYYKAILSKLLLQTVKIKMIKKI